MMLQGMAAAAAGHPGGLHHALQSPPNSNAAAINPAGGFLYLPQNPTGMQGPGVGQQMHHGRDLSPNSTPGLPNQPPPSATPPNQLMGGALDILNESQRQPQWHHAMTANQNFLLGGPRMMNPGANLSEKLSMEEQLKQHGVGDMFSPHNAADAFQGGGMRQHSGLNDAGNGNIAGQFTINQLQELTARGLMPAGSGHLGPGTYVPAQSPPTLFQQQQMPQPMPPRPRPEGGQDSSPTFLNEQSDVTGSMNGGGNTGSMNGSAAMNGGGIRKDPTDLIIGSWNDEDAEKAQQQQMGHIQQFQTLPPPNFGQQQTQQAAFMVHQQQMHNQRIFDEGHIQGLQGGATKAMHDGSSNAPAHGTPPSTGWGEPPTPSSHAHNNWGAGSQVMSGTPPNLSNGPLVPPPNLDGRGWGNPNFSAPPPGQVGMQFEAPQRIGRGGPRGGFGRGGHVHPASLDGGQLPSQASERGRGGRGGRGGNFGGGRSQGRGGNFGGPPVDHTQEKNAGRKSAIAETIAMMK